MITVTISFDDALAPPDQQAVAAITGGVKRLVEQMVQLDGIELVSYGVDVTPNQVVHPEGILLPDVCRDPLCTIDDKPGRPRHGPHTFIARGGIEA